MTTSIRNHDDRTVRSCINIAAAVIVGAFCLGVAPAAAHSPSDMALAYNGITQELTVTITHQVPDLATHYINKVQVSVNGRIVKENTYTNQPSPATFTYSYAIPAQAGDTIEVSASCVIGGSITRSISMPGPTATAPG